MPNIKKWVNFSLAQEAMQDKPLKEILSEEERAELRRIFGDEEDLQLGSWLYALRAYGMKTKGDLSRILSLDRRTMERVYGTIKLSKYLVYNLQEKVNDTRLAEAAPDEPMEAKNIRVRKVQDKLNQVLNGITPDKIYDSDLKDLAGAYKELLNGLRLETGQSTGNVSIMVNELSNPDAVSRNKNAMTELMVMSANIKKLVGDIDVRLEKVAKRRARAVKAEGKPLKETSGDTKED